MKQESKEYQALKTIDAANHGIVMFVDSTTPLIIDFQLFWFDEKITEFLSRAPAEMFVSTNGIRIGLGAEFKYTPAEMETEEGYLTGFSSNMQQDCYDKMSLKVDAEEEKIGIAHEVTQAISELVRAASDLPHGISPVMKWRL